MNDAKLRPERNRIIKEAFENEGFTVIDQTYKVTTLVSDKTPQETAGSIERAMAAIDARMKPLLESVLQDAIAFYRAEGKGRSRRERKLAGKRIEKMQALLAKVRGTGDFHYDFQIGAAEIEGGKDASYGEILATEMDATKAALMARAGDERVQIYSEEDFITFCKETIAIKDQLAGATLPYHGVRRRVFDEGRLDRDILRDIRKDSYKESLTSVDEMTLKQVTLYFRRVNTFDYVKHFTGSEVAAQGKKVAEAAALVKELESDRRSARRLSRQSTSSSPEASLRPTPPTRRSSTTEPPGWGSAWCSTPTSATWGWTSSRAMRERWTGWDAERTRTSRQRHNPRATRSSTSSAELLTTSTGSIATSLRRPRGSEPGSAVERTCCASSTVRRVRSCYSVATR